MTGISSPSKHWDDDRKKEPVTFDRDTLNIQAATNVLLATIPVLIEENAEFSIHSSGAKRDENDKLEQPTDWITIHVDTTGRFGIIKKLKEMGMKYTGSWSNVWIMAYRIMREGMSYEPSEVGKNLKLLPVTSWNYQVRTMLKFLSPSVKFLVKSEIEQIYVWFKDHDKKTSYGTYPPGSDIQTLEVTFMGRYGALRYMETVAKSQGLKIIHPATKESGYLRVEVPWKKEGQGI